MGKRNHITPISIAEKPIVVETEITENDRPSRLGIGVARFRVNLRSEPSFTANIYKVIEPNEEVTLIEQLPDSWYKVKYDCEKGFAFVFNGTNPNFTIKLD